MESVGPLDVRLSIDRLWDGQALPEHRHATVAFSLDAAALHVRFDAPHFGDPPPAADPGPTPRLWEHEVVELFLAGPAERYLELELGPRGHYLALDFAGVRKPVGSGHAIDYRVERTAQRVAGIAKVPRQLVPQGPLRANAYLIHATACTGNAGRCHHACRPVPGHRPDFHQLECFMKL